MARGNAIDLEMVDRVELIKRRLPGSTMKEIAVIAGISKPTVSRILSGKYDYLKAGSAPSSDAKLAEIAMKNNALLSVIATVLVNQFENPRGNIPNKEKESSFRDTIKANTIREGEC